MGLIASLDTATDLNGDGLIQALGLMAVGHREAAMTGSRHASSGA